MLNGDAFYDVPSYLIVLVLFLLALAANEMGFRIAGRNRSKDDKGLRSQANAIQGTLLGLLALLLGFSFSMALQRFGRRSQAVINEANAIGTTYLRTSLLPEGSRAGARDLLKRYVEIRVQATEIDARAPEKRQEFRDHAVELQQAIWEQAAETARSHPNPVISGYFVQSVNEMIDHFDARQAELDKHVPEEVLVLLGAVLVIGAGLLGYTSGLSGKRPMIVTIVMTILILMVLRVVIDLDRPRRGLIQIDQHPMLNLHKGLNPD